MEETSTSPATILQFRQVNRTGFVGGLIPREDVVHGKTQQAFPRTA